MSTTQDSAAERADHIRLQAQLAEISTLANLGLTGGRRPYTDDLSRLESIDALNQTVNRLTDALDFYVWSAVRSGTSYADIARALGVSRQRVQAKYGSSSNPQSRKA